MTETQLRLLSQIAIDPTSVADLTFRGRVTAAALMSMGSVMIKKTLNTSRLTITRLGREQQAFYQGHPLSATECHELIRQEVARVSLRQVLQVKHRLDQPKHEQRPGRSALRK